MPENATDNAAALALLERFRRGEISADALRAALAPAPMRRPRPASPDATERTAATRFSFTRARLAALTPPASGRLRVFDAGTRGLALNVSPQGARTFLVYRKHAGRPLQITLGRFAEAIPETRGLPEGAAPLELFGNHAALNVKMARALAVAVNAELDAGRNPAERERARRAELTLGELFEQWRKEYAEPKGLRSLPALRECFAVYLGKLDAPRKKHGRARKKPKGAVDWSQRRLSQITCADVQRLHAALSKRGTRTTANRVLEILSALYNKAILWNLASVNPARGIEANRETKRRRFLHADELPRFFRALGEDRDADFRDFVNLALLTGARRANVLGMRWRDVDLERGEWSIPEGDSKNAEALLVPLLPEAVAILTARKPKDDDEASPFVFPSDARDGHRGPFNKRWQRLLTRAGIADFRMHDLRRSMGSWQARTGASLTIIGKSLGHKSPSATAIYARLEVDPVRESMARAAAAIKDAAAKQEEPAPETVAPPAKSAEVLAFKPRRRRGA